MTKIREQATQLIKRTVGGSDHKDWFVELEDGIVELVDSQKKEWVKDLVDRFTTQDSWKHAGKIWASSEVLELINQLESK